MGCVSNGRAAGNAGRGISLQWLVALAIVLGMLLLGAALAWQGYHGIRQTLVAAAGDSAQQIGKTIDEREGKISGDIADARRLKQEAEAQAAAAEAELAEARSKAHKTAADAKAKAAANAAERQAAEEAKLNERLTTAEAEIRAARDQAMANVSTIAVETAQAIFEKLTGEKVTKTAVKAAVK